MAQPLLQFVNVPVSSEIYTIRAQSLRNAVMNLAVGGRLLRDDRDIIHVNALEGVSFALEEGDRLGIMGHRLGQDHLLKVVAGIYEPTHGTITVPASSSMLDIGLGLDYDATGIENIWQLARSAAWAPRR